MLPVPAALEEQPLQPPQPVPFRQSFAASVRLRAGNGQVWSSHSGSFRRSRPASSGRTRLQIQAYIILPTAPLPSRPLEEWPQAAAHHDEPSGAHNHTHDCRKEEQEAGGFALRVLSCGWQGSNGLDSGTRWIINPESARVYCREKVLPATSSALPAINASARRLASAGVISRVCAFAM